MLTLASGFNLKKAVAIWKDFSRTLVYLQNNSL